MNNKLTELITTSKYLTNDNYLDSLFKTKKSKKYRCKVCGKFTYQKSDKKNICVECRREYLNNKSE